MAEIVEIRQGIKEPEYYVHYRDCMLWVLTYCGSFNVHLIDNKRLDEWVTIDRLNLDAASVVKLEEESLKADKRAARSHKRKHEETKVLCKS